MARVYLETSFVSACVTDRKDAGSVYRREKSLEWWALQAQRQQQNDRFRQGMGGVPGMSQGGNVGGGGRPAGGGGGNR